MKFSRLLFIIAGIGIAAYLIVAQGFDDVLQALHLAGWTGLGSITLFHVLPTVLCGVAWWLLLRVHSGESWLTLTWVRWIRDGLDGVLPIVPVSGELIGARILALRGLDLAGASVIVDMTAELLSQVLYAMIGLALLIAINPAAPYRLWIAAGIGVMTLLCVGFLIAQKKGLFQLIDHPLEWIRRSRGKAVSATDRTLHDRILLLYRHGWPFLGCILVHLVAWLASAFETSIGLWFMGHPLPIGQVFAIEGLVYAVRAVTFFVPAGVGVQEGAYVLIGGMLGLQPDLALAVSLLKRGRDLIIGVPALLVWQIIEARQLKWMRRHNDARI